MELKGVVDEIIYQNEVNSYTICTMELEEEVITIVGYLPFITTGDTLKIEGDFVEHQEYGRQFKISTFEKLMPESAAAMEKYLAGGTIKGIGPATAKRIVDKFGEDTLHVFKFEPRKLAEVKGINLKRAEEIGIEFNEKIDVFQIVTFLEKFGIGSSNAKKVYDLLGKDAIAKIEENPYILIDIAYGVDFKYIDKMALDIGLPYDNEKRIESGIKYSLIISSYNGHTCVFLENLYKYVVELLDVSRENIENSLINLKAKEDITIEKREDGEWIYLFAFYKAEQNIAKKLITLEETKNTKKIKNFKTELKKQEKDLDIELSEKQKEAVETVNEHNVCVITGGPGTGKTTIIKTIISIFEEKGNKVTLCAPTGRAAKRITETTNREAKTIHRLLEIGKLQEESKLENVDTNVLPVDADVIIIDEMSMVDVFLMNYLCKGIYLGTKLVLVGDSNQLPSVGPGSILKDIIESEKIETVFLNKIFRQAAKSKIITNAHNVNNGESFIKKLGPDGMPEKEVEEVGSENDFFYINETNGEKMLANIISLCQGRLKKYGDYNFFKDIQILTPTKKGLLGTKELNKRLQKALNPNEDKKSEKVYGEHVYRCGDRVMQIKNNYDIYWDKIDSKEVGTGIFNGEIGMITAIDEESKQLKILFDDGKMAWYAYNMLDEIEHSYSITIHKAQGSEFEVVILVIPQAAPMLLTRNLLYTALTRAKKLLIVMGPERLVEYMVQNADSKIRNTGLEYKLKFE